MYPEWDNHAPAVNGNNAHRKNRNINTEDVEKYLKESTSFLDRYEKSSLNDKFCTIFKEAFKRQVHDENRAKAEGLIRINEPFETALHNLELLFEMKYDNRNLLYSVMKEYLKRRAESGDM